MAGWGRAQRNRTIRVDMSRPGPLGRLVLNAQSDRRRRVAGAALRLVAPVLPHRRAREPIFIVGAPRSGTTLLFSVLMRSPDLCSLGRESHFLWEMYHAAPAVISAHHGLSAADASERERHVVSWCIHAVCGDKRYLDKLPRNSLRAPFLQALFPDATFVFIRRDGPDTISSLITGWESGRFTTGIAPNGLRWQFLVPPGWEAYVDKPVAERAAFQWMASNDAILAARGYGHWVDVSYEELVADAGGTIERVCSELGVAVPLDVSLPISTTTLTPPRPDKWRSEHPEVAGLSIEDMRHRLGYGRREDTTGIK